MSKLTGKIGPEWVPCVKLPVIVHVREQRPGEKHVSTREGLTPVKPDDLIMRGVAGEEYPIGRELWEMTYTTDTASQPVATEPLLQRIAELEANEKVLLAQVQGHTKWREQIIKASEQAYGESAIRYKFSLTKSGKVMNTFPKEIDGRWFALVPAEDDGHIGHIARIAELERRIEAGKNIVRNDMHRIGQLQARVTELERQLEEARNQALEEAANAVDAMKAPDGYGIQEQSLYDVATMEAADVVRALKGAKE